jgi:hypothetical protein
MPTPNIDVSSSRNGLVRALMDPSLRQQYIIELKHDCLISLSAFEDLAEALKAPKPSKDLKTALKRMLRVYQSGHAFLSTAMVITWVLWPSETHVVENGRVLREEFGVTDDSALNTELRPLRNSLVPIGSRIENYASQEVGGRPMDWSIGPPREIAPSKHGVLSNCA